MTATGQNFEIYQGDSHQVSIEVLDEYGLPFDLTDYSITWVVYKPTTKNVVITKVTGSGIAVPSPASGIMLIDILPSDTENLEPRHYNHECEIMTNANNVYTVTTGIVHLLYSIA